MPCHVTVAAACKTRAIHAWTKNEPAHAVRKRAIREPLRLRNVDATASLRDVRKRYAMTRPKNVSPSQPHARALHAVKCA
eukprot:4576152-Lingulodinium_polyedra.AAC.1